MKAKTINSKGLRFFMTLALIFALCLCMGASAYAMFDFNFNFNFDFNFNIPDIGNIVIPDLTGLTIPDFSNSDSGSTGQGDLYWSQYDQSYLNSSQTEIVEQAKKDYSKAQNDFMNASSQAEKDAAQAVMNDAHTRAESVRADSSGNYSGGADGSQYIPLGGGGYYGGGGYTPSYSYFTISASAGGGGSISPSGSTSVIEGGSQGFIVTPNKGFKLEGVTVDGVSVGAVSSYTFSNVTAAHSISASFVPGGTVSIGSADLADKDGKGTVKSGYGIYANVQANFVDVENVYVTASYNFGKGTKTVTLEETAKGSFEFTKNTASPSKYRCVYIPVDTKDKTYTVTFTITGTNAAGTGISATKIATIAVKGDMYQDDFSGDRQ